MATAHLVNWNIRTASSHSTLKLTSERFAFLCGIRVSGPVQDGTEHRGFRLVVKAQGSKKGGNSGDKARRCISSTVSSTCLLHEIMWFKIMD